MRLDEMDLIGIIAERNPNAAAVLVRELTLEDLVRENELPKPKREETPLVRLTERHKLVARMLADSKPVWVVSVITGLAESTIHHLTRDPSFKNLLAFYKEQNAEAMQTFGEKMAETGMEFLDVIRDMLQDPEQMEKMTPGQKLEFLKVFADRTGYGPQSSQNVNVNINLADRLQAARKRLESMKVIEGEVIHKEDAA